MPILAATPRTVRCSPGANSHFATSTGMRRGADPGDDRELSERSDLACDCGNRYLRQGLEGAGVSGGWLEDSHRAVPGLPGSSATAAIIPLCQPACVFRSMTGRKRPEGATPSGLGRNDRSWGVASGRSFMANTVAENQTTRASTRALYSTLTSGNNAHPIHAAFRPGKPRIAESVASVGVGESNAAGTLCQVACFPLIGLASRYRSPSHLIACPLATL